MKLPTLSSPLKLFSPAPAQPALGAAGLGGNMMFASSGGGGGDYDPDDFDQYDDFDDQPAEPERRPRATRSSRSTGGDGRDATGGRPRTAQFQPEERYWTDYLRIALPVVGLLLLIGLLWFWADRLINDEPNTSEPVATETLGQVTTSTPTAPAATEPAVTTPPANNTASGTTETTPPPDTAGGDNQAGGETAPPAGETEAEATEPPADTGAAFTDGETVVVTEPLNLRPNPSTDGEPIGQLAAGDTLTITGGPTEGESYIWWEVLTADGETTGWVVQEFIEPAE